MTIIASRAQSAFMYIIRAVSLVRGTDENGIHRITCSPVEATDTELDSRRLDLDDGGSFAEYAAHTIGESMIFETDEPNRWVVGELIILKIKPVR